MQIKTTILLLAILIKISTAEHPGLNDNKTTMECICDVTICIKKCCEQGKYLTDKTQCETTKENFTVALGKIVSENYSLVNEPCRGKFEMLLLDPLNISEDAFEINKNGFLVLLASGDVYEDYCVDFIESTDIVRALLCFQIGSGAAGTRHVITGNSRSLCIASLLRYLKAIYFNKNLSKIML